jgi:hypothetical protein
MPLEATSQAEGGKLHITNDLFERIVEMCGVASVTAERSAAVIHDEIGMQNSLGCHGSRLEPV